MKLAFTVTIPDLTRALSAIASDAAGPGGRPLDRGGAGRTVSPEARRRIAAPTEGDDDRQS